MRDLLEVGAQDGGDRLDLLVALLGRDVGQQLFA